MGHLCFNVILLKRAR